MASLYTSFLQSPNPSALAANATLNYITTATSISEPTAILKHLQAQAKQLTQDDKVLSAIEGPNGVCLETETTLKFNTSGGAFLPGIDENLLDERTVTFPLVHVVTFDEAQKVKQIRLYWEQGTLLRQVEAIGRTGRNWPIKDGKVLVDAVKKSVKESSSGLSTNGKPESGNLAIREPSRSDSISATRDPHASLSLFSPRDPNQDSKRSYEGPAVVPRISAKPPPRDYNELFAGDDDTPSPTAHRSSSPSKVDGRSLKANAGQKFIANRLFDENVPVDAPKSPERKKTYGQKYDHFAFGDGEDAQATRPSSKGGKGAQHFSFEDFSTPPKLSEKSRPDLDKHWGSAEPAVSPERREIVHKPRQDADPHFEFKDDGSGTPAAKSRTTTNVDNARRGQDFGTHYEIADKFSPGSANKPKTAPRSDQESHWGFGADLEQKKIYKTAGDGMGGRGARTWGFGDGTEPEVEQNVRPSARSRRQAQGGAEY